MKIRISENEYLDTDFTSACKFSDSLILPIVKNIRYTGNGLSLDKIPIKPDEDGYYLFKNISKASKWYSYYIKDGKINHDITKTEANNIGDDYVFIKTRYEFDEEDDDWNKEIKGLKK